MMQIQIAQADILLGDKERNLRDAIKIIRDSDADLILFPEVFTTGFDFPDLGRLGEGISGETVDVLRSVCGDRMVAGSILEVEGGCIYNTFLLVDGEGILGRYRKIHLYGKEKDHLKAGDKVNVTQARGWNMGFAVCYDVRFPELFRSLGGEGAELILICANFPAVRQEQWRTLIRARAIENQVFVAACNRVGVDRDYVYAGGSMVVDPRGDILLELGGGQEVGVVEIDLGTLKETREKFPVLKDIRLI